VKIGKFFILYHPECYKKNREEAFEYIGKSDEQNLKEFKSNVGSFRSLLDSESISDSHSFFRTWGKQLSNVHLLSAVIGNAELFGSLGFFERMRLKRRLNQQRNAVIDVGNFYTEVYGTSQTERHMKELYPSSGEPTLEQLKNRESQALELLKEQISEVSNDLEALFNDAKKISRKTALKIKEEMKRQIREIPKHVVTL